MIHINLLPIREVEEASSRRKEVALAGGLIVLTCVAVFVAYLFQGAQLSEVNAELNRSQESLEKIRVQNQEFEKMEQQKKEIEEKIQVVRILTSPERRSASVHVLDDLSTSAPEFLWLTEFVEDKGSAKISGKAVDNQTIAAFAHNLSSSGYFRQVEIRETVQEAPQADPRRRTRAGRVDNFDSPLPIPVTRFLIEAHINYTPSRQEEALIGGKGGEALTGRKGPPIKKASEEKR